MTYIKEYSPVKRRTYKISDLEFSFNKDFLFVHEDHRLIDVFQNNSKTLEWFQEVQNPEENEIIQITDTLFFSDLNYMEISYIFKNEPEVRLWARNSNHLNLKIESIPSLKIDEINNRLDLLKNDILILNCKQLIELLFK